nr:ribonuclease H-like domain-containing protein [Tanacetum cinerariifolium]
MSVPVTAEEKIKKKNDVKAKSLLLMALSNEHQLTFSQYNDAKIMFAAIETRFGGVAITQEELNSKFLRSFPSKWNTHVVVWMNKAVIETMSIDDLYNNFKIVEQDVKNSVGTSTASTISPNVNTASPQVSTANFSDNDVYAFMAENPNGSNPLKSQDNTGKQGNNEDTSSKAMMAIDDKLIGSQITDNNKKGLGYHVVPPPHPIIYNGPTKLDLSYSGLGKFKEPEFKGYGPRDSKLESNINHDQKSDNSKENSDDSFVKQQVSKDTSSFVESPINVDKETALSVDKTIKFVKPKNYDKTVRKSVRFTWVFFLVTKDETSEILKNFIKEIENLVDKKVKIIRCDNGTEFKNKVMDDFCREKGKFDGKSDEGFFVVYSLSSKAFRVYKTRTRKVEENLHIGFLENKHMIVGNGPMWLFDIDSLTQSINYVPVAVGKISNESADGTHNEDNDKDKSEDDSSPKEVNAARQHVNTASLQVNTDHFELNTVDPSLNTASSSDPHSLTDMFKLGASDTLETTQVEFFNDRVEPDVDLGNIPNSYRVPTTLHSIIHKDHLIKNVIGEVQSFV